jgi:hypothetical protein
MRTALLNYLVANRKALLPFVVTDNLPWYDNGAPLYHHNKKHIYVDAAETRQTSAIDALNGSQAVDEVTTVRVYFVNDAKRLPTNYDSAVELIKSARSATGTEGSIQRLVQVTTDYTEDALTTQFEFSFRKIITN